MECELSILLRNIAVKYKKRIMKRMCLDAFACNIFLTIDDSSSFHKQISCYISLYGLWIFHLTAMYLQVSLKLQEILLWRKKIEKEEIHNLPDLIDMTYNMCLRDFSIFHKEKI